MRRSTDDFVAMSGWRRTWLMLRVTLVAVVIGGVMLFGLGVATKMFFAD